MHYLKVTEAAERLGVTRQTVYRFINRGDLPAYRLSGRRDLRLRSEDIDARMQPVDPGHIRRDSVTTDA